MGNGPKSRSRKHGGPKDQAKTQKTKRYQRDLDQIHADLNSPGKRDRLERVANEPEDIPGA